MDETVSSFEFLRRERIMINDGNPLDVPCYEISDVRTLVRHPVVSVCMTTYNHARYIAKAIKGVLAQQTDFEYELIIGDDCSDDETLDICRGFQNAHPDKLRVLWYSENVTQGNHAGGGNFERIRARCRGKYIAICEGDDYWVDKLKLQKQVDILEQDSAVGLVYAGCLDYNESMSCLMSDYSHGAIPAGRMSGVEFIRRNIYGCNGDFGPECFVRTCTVLLRQCVFQSAWARYGILKWRLRLGDIPLWLACAMESDVYYLPDVVAVYCKHGRSACATLGQGLWKDNFIARLYFYDQCRAKFCLEHPKVLARKYVRSVIGYVLESSTSGDLKEWHLKLAQSSNWAWILSCGESCYLHVLLRYGLLSVWTYPVPVLKPRTKQIVLVICVHLSLVRNLWYRLLYHQKQVEAVKTRENGNVM